MLPFDGEEIWRGAHLRQNLLHHAALRVGEAEIAATVTIRELFVIETEEVQHRGVQIVDGGFACDGFLSDVVGGAVTPSRLLAANIAV